MYAVVNTMTMNQPIDPGLVHRMQAELMQEARTVPGFIQASFIDLGGGTAQMVVICDSPAAVKDLHDNVGAPWIGANLVPIVERADRRLGPVVASTLF